ncbi:MAG: LuxR C-terminal-related transcriptional regulator [Acidimicrobiales bacterium]
MTNEFDQISSNASIAAIGIGTRDVFFAIADRQLSSLLQSSLDEAIWIAVGEASASAVLVSDDLARDTIVSRRRVVEVAAPFPRGAKQAVTNVSTRLSQGAILADDYASITAALSAITHGGVYMAERVFDLADQFPALTARQDAVLAKIAQGARTVDIVSNLHTSKTVVKLEIQAIENRLGVSGRAALVAAALSLGFAPRASGSAHKRPNGLT